MKKQDSKESVGRKKILTKQIQKEEIQLRWIIAGCILAILIFLVVWYYMKSIDQFKFKSIEFRKIKVGDVNIYQSKDFIFPKYNLNFRTDPRENNIPAVYPINLGKIVILSTSPEFRKCEGVARAYTDLAIFLVFADKQIAETTNNKLDAIENNQTYASCLSSSNDQSILMIQNSTTSEIVRDSNYPNCYWINMKNCTDFDSISEKFIINSVNEALQ